MEENCEAEKGQKTLSERLGEVGRATHLDTVSSVDLAVTLRREKGKK